MKKLAEANEGDAIRVNMEVHRSVYPSVWSHLERIPSRYRAEAVRAILLAYLDARPIKIEVNCGRSAGEIEENHRTKHVTDGSKPLADESTNEDSLEQLGNDLADGIWD